MRLEAGNTSGWVYGQIQDQGCLLSSYTLVNKSAVNVNANLAIRRSTGAFNIAPLNVQIFPGGMYPYGQLPIPVRMDKGDKVALLVTGGSVDYTFSYSNPED